MREVTYTSPSTAEACSVRGVACGPFLPTRLLTCTLTTAQAKTEERLRALRLRLYVSETRLQTRMAKVPPSMPHRARQEASRAPPPPQPPSLCASRPLRIHHATPYALMLPMSDARELDGRCVWPRQEDARRRSSASHRGSRPHDPHARCDGAAAVARRVARGSAQNRVDLMYVVSWAR